MTSVEVNSALPELTSVVTAAGTSSLCPLSHLESDEASGGGGAAPGTPTIQKGEETVPQRRARERFLLESFELQQPINLEDDVLGRDAYVYTSKCLDGNLNVVLSLPVDAVISELDKESVRFDHVGFGDRGIEALSEALRMNTTVTSLSLIDNQITPIGLKYLVGCLIMNRHITHLDLSENRIGKYITPTPQGGCGKGLKSLFTHNSTLLSVSLRGNRIVNHDIELLAEGLAENHSLQELDLSYNCIHQRGGAAVASILAKTSDLSFLNIAWNQLGPRGIQCVLSEGMMLNGTIRKLNLAWNGLDDECATLIGAIMRESLILEEIDLSHGRIGKKGADAIANGMRQSSLLTTVVLDDNPLKDDGCAAVIEAAKENRSMLKLSLKQTRSGQRALEKFAEAKEERDDFVVVLE